MEKEAAILTRNGTIRQHELKEWPTFYDQLIGGRSYEVRRADRDFRVGDELWIRKYDPVTQMYCGPSMRVEIAHITHEGTIGLPRDICVLGIVAKSPRPTNGNGPEKSP